MLTHSPNGAYYIDTISYFIGSDSIDRAKRLEKSPQKNDSGEQKSKPHEEQKGISPEIQHLGQSVRNKWIKLEDGMSLVYLLIILCIIKTCFTGNFNGYTPFGITTITICGISFLFYRFLYIIFDINTEASDSVFGGNGNLIFYSTMIFAEYISSRLSIIMTILVSFSFFKGIKN